MGRRSRPKSYHRVGFASGVQPRLPPGPFGGQWVWVDWMGERMWGCWAGERDVPRLAGVSVTVFSPAELTHLRNGDAAGADAFASFESACEPRVSGWGCAASQKAGACTSEFAGQSIACAPRSIGWSGAPFGGVDQRVLVRGEFAGRWPGAVPVVVKVALRWPMVPS
jgi:hypothetical protein